MYAGKIVESAPVDALFADPQHPYTIGLLGSIPRIEVDRERLSTIEGTVPSPNNQPKGCRFAPRCPFADPRCRDEPPPLRDIGADHRVACWKAPVELGRHASRRRHRQQAPVLQVDGLVKHFLVARGLIRRKVIGMVRAVEGVSFEIARGETLALVGESGCGKSTTGRLVLRLMDPTAGSVRFKGEEIADLDKQALRRLRRHMQIIFQDPYASLNPRMTVGEILAEPMAVHDLAHARPSARRGSRSCWTWSACCPSMRRRYPHQFSGGQRQRIGIARALAVNPDLIVCDEPVSALDVSIQAQIVNLLQNLQQRFGLSYLFIAHDLAVVKHISDRVAVMYLGQLVEIADQRDLYDRPLHPYTQALLSAIPRPDPSVRKERVLLAGDVPSPLRAAAGLPLPHALHRTPSRAASRSSQSCATPATAIAWPAILRNAAQAGAPRRQVLRSASSPNASPPSRQQKRHEPRAP